VTRPTPRIIKDAGGLDLACGSVRSNVLWRLSGGLVRSDVLDQLDAAKLDVVIDLRNHHEAREVLIDWAGVKGVRYVHVPLLVLSMEQLAGELSALTTMEEARAHQVRLYQRLVDEHAADVARVIDELAGAGVAGFGCAAGKDRTGLINAVVLVLLGATADEAASHYAAVAPSVEDLMPLALAHFGEDTTAEDLPVSTLAHLTVEAWVMRELLTHLDERHGGVEAWLLAAGVRPDTPGRLRAKLLVSG